jgi:acetyl esterase/lipase
MPPRQSQQLAARLRAAGVPVRLVLVQGAGHGLDNPSQRPTPDQLTRMVADFFTRSLGSSQQSARSDRTPIEWQDR